MTRKVAHCRCPHVKCVVVGDAGVGKTSLIVSYTTNCYPRKYVPTAYDTFSVLVTVDGQPVNLELCDTAGKKEFGYLRLLCYPNTDVFILCFSILSPKSFLNLKRRYWSELRRFSSKPFILVGTKCDLLLRNMNTANANKNIEKTNFSGHFDHQKSNNDNFYDDNFVSKREALEFASKTGALAYLECSALTQYNLKEVFDTAITAALYKAVEDFFAKPMNEMNYGYNDMPSVKRKRYISKSIFATGNTSESEMSEMELDSSQSSSIFSTKWSASAKNYVSKNSEWNQYEAIDENPIKKKAHFRNSKMKWKKLFCFS